MAVPGYEVTEPQLRCVLRFEAVLTEVRLLRRAAAEQLGRWDMLVAVGEAELLVTELATNVVKHVGEGTSATLILERRGVWPRAASARGVCGRLGHDHVRRGGGLVRGLFECGTCLPAP